MKKLLLLCFMALSVCSALAQDSNPDALDVFLDISRNETGSAIITSEHLSSISGIRHVYFQQVLHDIEVFGQVGSLHLNADDKVVEIHNDFLSIPLPPTDKMIPSIDAEQAIIMAAGQMSYAYAGDVSLLHRLKKKNQHQTFNIPSLSKEKIIAKLIWLPQSINDIQLTWNFQFLEHAGEHWYDLYVDSKTGLILHQEDWTVSCRKSNHHHPRQLNNKIVSRNNTSQRLLADSSQYQVYALPLKSPADGNRSIEICPHDTLASPFAWHDTNAIVGADFTITSGNNVYAYEDGDNPGFSPDGGSMLQFNFTIDTTYSDTLQSESAAITNLFYWNNILHDITYQYGFNEAAGNCQFNNYGKGGVEQDHILAEAQDNSSTCTSTMSFPVDGISPRMQINICEDRDGSFDNMVIVHEFTHVLTNRLTGGAANSGCLNNPEQMGEGWSDYFALMMTMKSGDNGDFPTTIGTWISGDSIDGPGLRQFPYTTDMTLNPLTYDDVHTASIPHGIGAIWCSMLWEMTWNLIEIYGFDPDLYHGTGGNNIALSLVMEGLKLQRCDPGFQDGRDAILLADSILYNGQNFCAIWKAFAKRGMGFSADQGSQATRVDGVEAFDIPGDILRMNKTAEGLINAPGDTITYFISIKNGAICGDTLINLVILDTIPEHMVYVENSATAGSIISNGIIQFPTVNLFYPGDSIGYSFQVISDTTFMLDHNFTDDMESGAGNWSRTSVGSSTWKINNTNPFTGSQAWFGNNVSQAADQFLRLDIPISPDGYTQLNFWHYYDTEVETDGGVVQYSPDFGLTWFDLGPFMIKNGYNSIVDNNLDKPGFSGQSGGYILTSIDLSSFINQTIIVRFWMNCDEGIGGDGWYIDDVLLSSNYVINEAFAYSDSGFVNSARLVPPTFVEYSSCTNGVLDGDETSIDCGGPLCAPCPTCSDGIENGDEDGIDCGGSACPTCPTCDDGIQNGTEAAIDCGGLECDPCPCMQNNLTLRFTFDNYPGDISWELKNGLGEVIFSDGPYFNERNRSTLNINFCLPDDCYELIVNDDFCDGLCCTQGNGFYRFIDNNNGIIVASGSDIGCVDSTSFCLPTVVMSPCDSLNLITGTVTSGTYKASEIIRSTGSVSPPEIVYFLAEDYIELDTGFTVEKGAQFTADIEACVAALRAEQEAQKKMKNMKPDIKSIQKN